MGSKKISKDDFNNIVKDCFSIADVCRKIGWQPRGNNYKIIHQYIEEYETDVTHFTGQKTHLLKKENQFHKMSVEEYIKGNRLINGSILLKKLIKENYKQHICENCGQSTWLGNPIPLEIHHIDGNTRNNNLNNLKVLCPNCHALTDNFAGKKNKKKHNLFCKDCGKEISKWSKSGLCCSCARKKQRKVERPSIEILEKLLEKHSMESIGRMYGVSGRTIKKWYIQYKKNTDLAR